MSREPGENVRYGRVTPDTLRLVAALLSLVEPVSVLGMPGVVGLRRPRYPLGTTVTPDDLLTLRAIEQLKYRYLRTLDLKDWDAFAEVFEPDATGSYGAG